MLWKTNLPVNFALLLCKKWTIFPQPNQTINIHITRICNGLQTVLRQYSILRRCVLRQVYWIYL